MTQLTFNLIIGTLLRSLIMVGAGWLVAHGMLPQGSTEEWVGAVVLVVLGVLWSLYQKYVERIKLLTALQSKAGTTEEEVVAKIASGQGARLSIVLLAAAVALSATACGAARARPRHQGVVALETVTAALGGVQDAEKVFRANRPCETVAAPCISAADHQAFGAQMVKVWALDADAAKVVRAWQPGQPVPAQLGALVTAIRGALVDALTIAKLDATTQATVFRVYDAIAQLLAMFAG